MRPAKRASFVAAALAFAPATPAAAAGMDVATFLTKATALKAKGPMALFSSDLGLLKREAAVATAQISAEKKARAAAHQPPLYCAAEKERMSADEMIAGLSTIPPAERGMSLKDGFTRVIIKRYPCK